MEQKMLLPIVVVVLLAGFLMGFYAAGIGANDKGSGSIVGKITSQGLYFEPHSRTITAADFSETFTGTVKKSTSKELILTVNGNDVSLPLAMTKFFKPPPRPLGPDVSRQPPLGELAASDIALGDSFTVTAKYNLKQGTLERVTATRS